MWFRFSFLLAFLVAGIVHAETPSAIIQFPNLAEMPDRSAELQKRIDENRGALLLKAGVYRLSKTLVFELGGENSALIRPENGPVTLVMDGPGPAIRIVGSHEGSASPKTFLPSTWNESTPTIEGIEILGNHPEADGIELYRTFQPIITRVSVRWCRHAVHLVERNRNVTLAEVNLYENQGIGLFLDDVNLHQINVSNSHISYNRGGGIVVRDGNVRNLQITGCDIEANVPDDDRETQTANIFFDLSGSADTRSRSIAEVTIANCSIQHSSNYAGKDYKELAPGAANIRLLGKEIYPIDSVTISGNVMSDTSLNVDLKHCTDITFTGNNLFAPNPDNLHITQCKRIIVNGNTFNPREFERPGRIVFDQSEDCVFSNNTVRGSTAEDGALIVRNSSRISLTSNILTESKSGVVVEGSSDLLLRDWLVSGLPEGVEWLTSDKQSTRIATEGLLLAP